MKQNCLLILLALFTGFAFNSCNDDDEDKTYYIDHSILLVDAEGKPYDGLDCYLYFISDKAETLLSTARTDANGIINYTKSYVGSYFIKVGYIGSETTYEIGEFFLEKNGPTNHTFSVTNEFFEVDKTSIPIKRDGLANDGKNGKFVIISTSPWELELGAGIDWITLSSTSGAAGKHEITLDVKPNDGEARTANIEVMAENGKTGTITVEQAGSLFFEDDLEWIKDEHPDLGYFLENKSDSRMKGWDNNKNYRGWTRYIYPNTSAATYLGRCFFKLCTTEGRPGGVISPPMVAIGNEFLDVILTIEVAKYMDNRSEGTGEITVEILGSGTFEDGKKTKDFVATNTVWNVFQEKQALVKQAGSDTKFLIRPVDTPTVVDQQFMFKSISVVAFNE